MAARWVVLREYPWVGLKAEQTVGQKVDRLVLRLAGPTVGVSVGKLAVSWVQLKVVGLVGRKVALSVVVLVAPLVAEKVVQ